MKKLFSILVLLLSAGICGMAGTFDRGLGNPQSVYVPKGQFSWTVGGSYTTYSAKAGDDVTKGVNLAGLVTDANGTVGLAGIEGEGFWFFRDNWALGVKASYSNTSLDANNLSILGLVSVSNKHVRREVWSGTIACRQYIPLFDSRVLAFFGEAGLGGSFGYNKNYEDTSRGKEGIFSVLYDVAFNITSGLSVFLTDKMSVELGLPVFTVAYEWNKMLEKQEDESTLSGFRVAKSLNVLGVTLGVSFYF